MIFGPPIGGPKIIKIGHFGDFGAPGRAPERSTRYDIVTQRISWVDGASTKKNPENRLFGDFPGTATTKF